EVLQKKEHLQSLSYSPVLFIDGELEGFQEQVKLSEEIDEELPRFIVAQDLEGHIGSTTLFSREGEIHVSADIASFLRANDKALFSLQFQNSQNERKNISIMLASKHLEF